MFIAIDLIPLSFFCLQIRAHVQQKSTFLTGRSFLSVHMNILVKHDHLPCLTGRGVDSERVGVPQVGLLSELETYRYLSVGMML